LRSHWRKLCRTHPTFRRYLLIVSEVQIQAACRSGSYLGNHTTWPRAATARSTAPNLSQGFHKIRVCVVTVPLFKRVFFCDGVAYGRRAEGFMAIEWAVCYHSATGHTPNIERFECCNGRAPSHRNHDYQIALDSYVDPDLKHIILVYGRRCIHIRHKFYLDIPYYYAACTVWRVYTGVRILKCIDPCHAMCGYV
jgi:hypothetical protein